MTDFINKIIPTDSVYIHVIKVKTEKLFLCLAFYRWSVWLQMQHVLLHHLVCFMHHNMFLKIFHKWKNRSSYTLCVQNTS